MIKKLLCKISNEYKEQVEQSFYDNKSKWIESVLGKEHEMVMHAIIPYAIGGPVDMYMYPKCLNGTVFATKEMVEWCSQECKQYDGQYYEVVMATKLAIDEREESDFSKTLLRYRKIMTRVARYSGIAVLKSNDTIEIPMGDNEENACAIITEVDVSKRNVIDGVPIALQYIIEIHRSEMDYARNNGSAALIDKLKKGNLFPFSDVSRSAVI
jgi:hypothetical protein